jgi:ribose transport system permease protein/inositol transport system permease protein
MKYFSAEIKNNIKHLASESALFFFLILICIIISVLFPRFLTMNNLINVASQVSINALLATGMTFVILTGGIDLSVGSVAALSGILITMFIKTINGPSIVTVILTAIIGSLVIGGICGVFLGAMVAWFKVAPFIAALAMLSIARGCAYVLTNSRPIFDLPDNYGWIGQGYVGPIPVIVIFMAVVMIIAYIVLSKTCYGRYIYAVGSNSEMAALNGVSVNKIILSVYVICSVLAALGGVCLSSRIGTGQPSAANGYELDAIAAVVMGGTSLNGGSGSIVKTLLGVLTIGIINNGLSLLRVSSYVQQITMGIIILIAVIVDQIKKR